MIHFLRNGPDLLEYENPLVTLIYLLSRWVEY